MYTYTHIHTHWFTGVEITAPVVVVSSFDELTAKGEAGDVAGKIVVYAVRPVSS